MASQDILSGFTDYTEDAIINENLGQRTPVIDEPNSVELATEGKSEPTGKPEDVPNANTDKNQTKEKATEKSTEPRLTQLPLSRVRNLMKLDSDLQVASAEAVFLIAKATELFIDSLAKETFLHTAQQKKRTMQKRDVDMAVESVDSLMFLDGALNF